MEEESRPPHVRKTTLNGGSSVAQRRISVQLGKQQTSRFCEPGKVCLVDVLHVDRRLSKDTRPFDCGPVLDADEWPEEG